MERRIVPSTYTGHDSLERMSHSRFGLDRRPGPRDPSEQRRQDTSRSTVLARAVLSSRGDSSRALIVAQLR